MSTKQAQRYYSLNNPRLNRRYLGELRFWKTHDHRGHGLFRKRGCQVGLSCSSTTASCFLLGHTTDCGPEPGQKSKISQPSVDVHLVGYAWRFDKAIDSKHSRPVKPAPWCGALPCRRHRHVVSSQAGAPRPRSPASWKRRRRKDPIFEDRVDRFLDCGMGSALLRLEPATADERVDLANPQFEREAEQPLLAPLAGKPHALRRGKRRTLRGRRGRCVLGQRTLPRGLSER